MILNGRLNGKKDLSSDMEVKSQTISSVRMHRVQAAAFRLIFLKRKYVWRRSRTLFSLRIFDFAFARKYDFAVLYYILLTTFRAPPSLFLYD